MVIFDISQKNLIFAKLAVESSNANKHLHNTMDNKTFIINLAQRLGCDHDTAQKLTDGFCSVVREECAAANRVAIPGFGSFEGQKNDEKISTDLASGKRMLLPPSIDVTFNPGAMLKKKLKEQYTR